MPVGRRASTAALWLLLPAIAAWTGARPEAADGPLAVATLFPVYDFTRVVAGERLAVHLLLPPGVEAHTYEPTPADVMLASRAVAFVHTGVAMEPWVPGFLAGVGNAALRVVDATRGIDLARDPGDPDHEMDPHVWLDPTLASRMVATIADALVALDPEGESYYRENQHAYQDRLADLDRRIAGELAGVSRRTIVHGGHTAFGYFARRYGLEVRTPYRGFSPDSEPTPRAVAELVELLRETGSRVVFHEELLEPRVARAVAEATGARVELLHGVHNVTRDEMERGVSYLSLMEDNLAALKEALSSP